jgi:calcium-dependent protein kinase
MGNSCSLIFFKDSEEAALDENLNTECKTDPNENPELRSRTSQSRSLIDWRTIRMKYQILYEISNSRNTVLILEHQTTEEIYAAKILLMGYNSYATIDSIALSIPDVEVPLKLDCPFILKLYQVAHQGRNVFLISEFCGGGTLEARIRDKKRFSERRVKNIMYMLLYGVNHMHQNNYIHRDLAPRNILFESKKKSSIIKIIDFDITKKMCSKLNQRMGDEYYYHYLAPEMIRYNNKKALERDLNVNSKRPRSTLTSPRRSYSYNEKVDIWSCGVILYQMLSKI